MPRIQVPANMKLRAVDDDDHEWFIDLHNDPEVLKNLTHPEPITRAQHMAWWENVSSDRSQLRLVFTVDDHRVGHVKFYDIDNENHSVALGADIHKMYRGNGYAKHMWALMLNMCFDTMKMNRVWLTTAAYNKIGYRVYKNLGFKEEGKFTQSLFRDNRYHDQLCMYMLHNDWELA